ncbi:hypothetical protein PHYBLDRAFT_171356 [Phycomyces blakesleeanus NRRL 1555(-)]|uniref:Uncharacterized protein n=1 Tax=Phycomyces blakesleeanus (strain ATCC 8743b / DSM 1359 / FGSC 10004 / NBRC 33097 / NRRL 1555) TaxID=763407 RepID=A0A163DDZ8_PHYB8|nr:hypothetical protein PHYBLDRAFT_171356 [Phycomyces blakesleeanus NRRL 1555(-)]OAD70610.1 hypothetical protein PHYBLDRAFT_171356 [Phycomyces blakesleeanus NRRL 1555(-)]|eukprot:XP_018288650.1 hypothetical protein PHYBLDRAFT_171356 [Phycomyces blakesleeanus NRRL 1555(-)]
MYNSVHRFVSFLEREEQERLYAEKMFENFESLGNSLTKMFKERKDKDVYLQETVARPRQEINKKFEKLLYLLTMTCNESSVPLCVEIKNAQDEFGITFKDLL